MRGRLTWAVPVWSSSCRIHRRSPVDVIDGCHGSKIWRSRVGRYNLTTKMDGESPPLTTPSGQMEKNLNFSTGTSQLSTGQREPLNHGTEPSTWKNLKWKMCQKPSIE